MPIDIPLVSAITVTLLIVATVCAITDIFEHRVPNTVLLPTLVLAFILHGLLAGLPGLLDCTLGLMLGMAMLFPVYFLGGTSAGDVKLLGVVGSLLGTNGALIAGVATLFFGSVLGVLFIAWRLIEPIVSAHIVQFVGSSEPTAHLLTRTMTRDRVWKSEFPYAPAIACGAYYALWHLGYITQVVR